MQDVCNGERAAGSRLLGSTNSPETRLVRVLFFVILAIGSGALLWLAFVSPSALLSGCVVLFIIFFFSSSDPPLHPTKPYPVLSPHPSICTVLIQSWAIYHWDSLPWALANKKKRRFPITSLLCCWAIDAFPNGCRWVQAAIGTGPWSALLF